MTTAPNQVRLDRLFERIAPAYDLQLLLERRALKAAARLAGPLGGLRGLDLATGTGALAAAMLDRLDPPAELVAVDRSPAMLARAGKRLAHFEGRSRISVTLADAPRCRTRRGTSTLWRARTSSTSSSARTPRRPWKRSDGCCALAAASWWSSTAPRRSGEVAFIGGLGGFLKGRCR